MSEPKAKGGRALDLARRTVGLVSLVLVWSLLGIAPAAAHPAPTDSRGGHLCDEPSGDAGLCGPVGSYHCVTAGCDEARPGASSSGSDRPAPQPSLPLQPPPQIAPSLGQFGPLPTYADESAPVAVNGFRDGQLPFTGPGPAPVAHVAERSGSWTPLLAGTAVIVLAGLTVLAVGRRPKRFSFPFRIAQR